MGEIKIGDRVRYARNDIMPIQGCTGKVIDLYVFEYRDGLKVDCAQVVFERQTAFRFGSAVVNFEKVEDRTDDTAQRIAALEAENAALKAERDALRGLLDEAKQVIAPVVGVAKCRHIVTKPNYATLHVEDTNRPTEKGFGVQMLTIGKSDIGEWQWFNVEHIRAIATFAAKLDEQSK